MTDGDKDKSKDAKITKTEDNKSEPKVEPVVKDEPVSKEDFVALQKSFQELQTSHSTLLTENVTIKKDGLMEEIKKLNPKLAEANKDAELSTLKIVLDTAKQVVGTVPKHSKGAVKEVKIENAGYKKLGEKEWTN